MHTCGVRLLFPFPPHPPGPLLLHSQSLLCYSCFKSTRENSRCCKFSKFFPSSQKWKEKKSSRSNFFWQYLLPQAAIFMPSVMRRSCGRLWIVWETKKNSTTGRLKKVWNANWRHFRHNKLDEWLYKLRKHCFIISFQLKSLPSYEKYLPLYFLTLLLLVGKRKI